MSLEKYAVRKEVKAIGNGAHVTVPKELIGEEVLVEYPAAGENGE